MTPTFIFAFVATACFWIFLFFVFHRMVAYQPKVDTTVSLECQRLLDLLSDPVDWTLTGKEDIVLVHFSLCLNITWDCEGEYYDIKDIKRGLSLADLNVLEHEEWRLVEEAIEKLVKQKRLILFNRILGDDHE